MTWTAPSYAAVAGVLFLVTGCGDSSAVADEILSPEQVCNSIAGASFESVEERECGPGFPGIVFCRWTIHFDTNGTFSWNFSDTGETGAYRCTDTQIIGDSGGDPFLGSYSETTGVLIWDGIEYRRTPGGVADPGSGPGTGGTGGTGGVAGAGGVSCIDGTGGIADNNPVFSDETFQDLDWTTLGWIRDLNESWSAAQTLEEGNPDQHRRVLIDRSRTGPSTESGMITIHRRTGAFYVPSESGAVESLDYSEDAKAISGEQQTGAALCQATLCYVAPAAFIGAFEDWQTVKLTGLTSEDFVRVDAGLPLGVDENSHPDFSSAGSAMGFGFFRVARSSTGDPIPAVKHEGGIDNWSLQVNREQLPQERCN